MELSEYHQWWKHQGGQELRRILVDEWDPIGVRGSAGTADEYDGYRGPITDRLRTGASAQELAEYLSSVERRHMGMDRTGRTWEDLLPLSERLIRWYGDSIDSWSQAVGPGTSE